MLVLMLVRIALREMQLRTLYTLFHSPRLCLLANPYAGFLPLAKQLVLKISFILHEMLKS